ncbi:MAG: hypothetical protein E2O90_01560 [Alphaproteobacteria bacterium]|nr:MAG: hypothetical protein E2O90_01560 [Alphaproteobacteria bacterium]
MAFTSWRGIVGFIKPTMRPGSTEDLIRILPEGIGVIPLFCDIRSGSRDEYLEQVAPYEEKVALLAEHGVDVIHAEGSASFIVHGFAGERRITRAWQRKYGVPVFTSGQNHIAAMKALKIKTAIGVRPGWWDKGNKTLTKYFADAGINLKHMENPGTSFDQIGQITHYQVYELVRKAYRKHPDVDGIYLLGSAMRVGAMIETIERDFGLPVVSALTARCWEIQKRLCVHQPVENFGRLLRELP